MSLEPEFHEWVRYVEGDLEPTRAAQLLNSPQRDESMAAAKDLIRRLSDTDVALETIDLLPMIHRELESQPSGRAPSGPFVVSVMALAAAAAVGVFWFGFETDGRFQSKGEGFTVEAERWAGVDMYRVVGTKTERSPEAIDARDGLVFAYRNGGPRPFSHLMLFAVDESGRVYWFFPAWTEAVTPPTSMPIVAGQEAIELREVVQHDFAPGRLVVHALFSRKPFGVDDIEHRLQEFEQLPEVQVQHRALVVRP